MVLRRLRTAVNVGLATFCTHQMISTSPFPGVAIIHFYSSWIHSQVQQQNVALFCHVPGLPLMTGTEEGRILFGIKGHLFN